MANSARSATASSSTTAASTKPSSGWRRVPTSATWRWRAWQQVKLHYIGLLTNHHQPELAETFFNSVTTKILHRAYFRNDFIFVRPAISTEYIENDEPASQPTYRAYYPSRDTLRDTLLRIVNNFQLHCEFEDLGRDVDQVMTAMRAHTGERRLRTNYQIQVLSSLFFRNKGAYIVGKVVNGFNETPFALPILHRGPAAGDRHRCSSAKTTCSCCSASHAPTSWSRWRCRAPTCSFCAR